MSGTEIPPAAALYSEVDDIVKQQGERRHGLIHHLQTGRALPSLLIFPQRTPGKIHGGPQKAEDNADNKTDNNQTALIITVGAHTSCRNLMKITKRHANPALVSRTSRKFFYVQHRLQNLLSSLMNQESV